MNTICCFILFVAGFLFPRSFFSILLYRSSVHQLSQGFQHAPKAVKKIRLLMFYLPHNGISKQGIQTTSSKVLQHALKSLYIRISFYYIYLYSFNTELAIGRLTGIGFLFFYLSCVMDVYQTLPKSEYEVPSPKHTSACSRPPQY